MNAPGMIEVPLLVAAPDGRMHEVARLVYVLEEESRVAELEAENGKLRELVRDMHKLLKLSAEIPAKVSHVHLTEQRMRELGIGVEE